MSLEQLTSILGRKGYGLANSTRPEVEDTELERDTGHEPLAAPQAQERDTARYVVVVTSFRNRLIDEDNLCEKFHIDSLRYAGLIPEDTPQKTHIQVRQEKVRRNEERTEIQITKTI